MIVVNVFVYAGVWRHDFVNFDDPEYVSKNPNVASGLTWQGLSWAMTTGYAGNWHPLTWLSHMLDIQMYGLNPGPHHLTNLLLHIANTLLLFGLLRQMTGALGRSAFVAALFAVHPLHVESVAWLAERKDVLSTLFWILTLWAYLAYVRRPGLSRYLAVFVSFGLGLMAKPMLVTLPFVLFLLDFWPLRRLSLGANFRIRPRLVNTPEQRATPLQVVKEKVPLLALSIASSFVTFLVHRRAGAVSGLVTLPVGVRLANAALSYVAYIDKTLWPVQLAALYPYPRSVPRWPTVLCALGLIAVSGFAILTARRRPYLAVGWLWYLGTLVPVIGLVQVGAQATADRYTYVPLIGLFLIIAWGITDLFARWPHRQIAAAALVVTACSIAAQVQVKSWANSLALWQHALEVTNENRTAHILFANALSDQGRVDEAIAHYREAIRITPDEADGHYNLGTALASEGRLDEAIAVFSEAVRLKPDFAAAHINLGVALMKRERVGEAIQEFREALRIDPDKPDWHYNLAVSLDRRGDTNEAVHQLEIALKLNAEHENAWRMLDSLMRRRRKAVSGTLQ